MNTLMIMPDPSNKDFYIALYTGETGSGEMALEEEACSITGTDRNEIISNAAIVWGIDLDSCEIDFCGKQCVDSYLQEEVD